MTPLDCEHTPTEESGEPLVNLAGYGFELEPVYYHNGLSDTPEMYLRQTAAERLAAVRDKLAPLNIKIWDGWRPRHVQRRIFKQYWRALASDHPEWTRAQLREQVGIFVAAADDPCRTPFHATGGSVDLTLVDQSGTEIDMGTGFDHFGATSAALYFEKNDENQKVRDNRRMLRDAMCEADFRYDDDEWWHFDYGNQIWAAALGKPKAIYGEVKRAAFSHQHT